MKSILINKYAVILILISGLLNLIFYFHTGPILGGDSLRYIHGSNSVLFQLPLVDKEPSYIGYIYFLAALKTIGFNYDAIILLQIFVSMLAGWVLYLIGTKVCNRRVGLLATAFFLFNVDIMRWNLYILTDSIYISCIIFYTYLISKFFEVNLLCKSLIILLIFAFSSIRPNGLILMPAFIIFLMYKYNKNTVIRILGFIGILSLFFSAIYFSDSIIKIIDNEKPFDSIYEGVIVAGDINSYVKMPPFSSHLIGLKGFLEYFWAFPIDVILLLFKRVISELTFIRSFASLKANLSYGCLYLLMEFLAIYGFIMMKNSVLKYIILAIILGHLGIVMALFSDWNGRFICYVLPLIFIYTASGFEELRAKLGRY